MLGFKLNNVFYVLLEKTKDGNKPRFSVYCVGVESVW